MANAAPSGPPEDTEPETAIQPSPASISDPPAADQTVLHGSHTYTTIKEGLAYILIPPDAPLSQNPNLLKGEAGPAQSVFYNPIQQYNRDLTVLAIRAFGEGHVAEKMAKIEQGREKRHKKADKNKEKQVKGQQETQGTKKRKLEDAATEDGQGPDAKKSKPDRNRYVISRKVYEKILAAWQEKLPGTHRY
jgi:tRNA (guanine26-N2/guanine27-N2)-dimethyltransferase